MILATFYPFSQTTFFQDQLGDLPWSSIMGVVTVILSRPPHEPHSLCPLPPHRLPDAYGACSTPSWSWAAVSWPSPCPGTTSSRSWCCTPPGGLLKAILLGLLDRLPGTGPPSWTRRGRGRFGRRTSKGRLPGRGPGPVQETEGESATPDRNTGTRQSPGFQPTRPSIRPTDDHESCRVESPAHLPGRVPQGRVWSGGHHRHRRSRGDGLSGPLCPSTPGAGIGGDLRRSTRAKPASTNVWGWWRRCSMPRYLNSLPGDTAVGHVRYSTAGGAQLANAQPIMVRYAGGDLAIAHNGNLTNAHDVRETIGPGRGHLPDRLRFRGDHPPHRPFQARDRRRPDRRCPHLSGGSLLRHHLGGRHPLCRPGPPRLPAPGPGPEGRRVRGGQRDLRPGHHRRGVRPGRVLLGRC